MRDPPRCNCEERHGGLCKHQTNARDLCRLCRFAEGSDGKSRDESKTTTRGRRAGSSPPKRSRPRDISLRDVSPLDTQVNAGELGRRGHKLDFQVEETYGDEQTSILSTAVLWTKNISAYIGPQETCIHEGRMAAAFNIPMISYVNDLLRHSNFRV